MAPRRTGVHYELARCFSVIARLETLCVELKARVEKTQQRSLTVLRKQVLGDLDCSFLDEEVLGDTAEKRETALRQKILQVCELYTVREANFAVAMRTKELQRQLLEEQMKAQFTAATQESLKSQAYKEQIDTLGKTEQQLRAKLRLYAEKFEQLQGNLSKSNEVFASFKLEMDRLTRVSKTLEKDNSNLRQKCEHTDNTLINMSEAKSKMGRRIEQLESRSQKLEQLCRHLQNELKHSSTPTDNN